MAKILSYSFLVISNRLRRSEVACRRYYESDGLFHTVPQFRRASLTRLELEASQISGTEISRVLGVFFAKPESSEKILASLKPWGYAGIQSLSSMIIDEACNDGTLAERSGQVSRRNHDDRSHPRDRSPEHAISTTRAPQNDANSIADVRPWLTPDAKWFPLIPCKYFSVGRCHKADDCTFLHPAMTEDKRSTRTQNGNLEASRPRDRMANAPLKTHSIDRETHSESYRTSSKVNDRTKGYDSPHHFNRSDRPQETRRESGYSYKDDRDRYDRYARRQEYDIDPRDTRRRYLPTQQSASAADKNVRRDSSRSPSRGLRRRSADDTRATDAHAGGRTRDTRDELRHDRPPRYQESQRDVSRSRTNHESTELEGIYKPLPSLNTSRTSRPLQKPLSEQVLKRSPQRSPQRSPRDEYPALVEPAASNKPSISVSAADIIKNADNLLNMAKRAVDEQAREDAITMLNRYLTLQSRIPKVENNMHIYEYLLEVIERASEDQRQRYFRFLQDYILITNKGTGELNHMNAMMELAESSTGDLQVRAVPLLDRYMSLSSSLA